jgi:hypothetical protein
LHISANWCLISSCCGGNDCSSSSPSSNWSEMVLGSGESLYCWSLETLAAGCATHISTWSYPKFLVQIRTFMFRYRLFWWPWEYSCCHSSLCQGWYLQRQFLRCCHQYRHA